MNKPKLQDYGLKGLDSRPEIDIESAPITDDERTAALEHLIKWQVGTFRARNFRTALRDWEWANTETR